MAFLASLSPSPANGENPVSFATQIIHGVEVFRTMYFFNNNFMCLFMLLRVSSEITPDS